MIKRLFLGLIGISIVVVGAVSAFASTPAPNYSETFDGTPATPLAWSGMNFDVQTHIRSSAQVTNPETTMAEHGPDCSAPPATHAVSTFEDSVFQCKDHLMTAINASDYGVIYLTPNVITNWANSESVITFDVSTKVNSVRDWWDIWVQPFDNSLALPFSTGDVDLNGEPSKFIHVEGQYFNGEQMFRGYTQSGELNNCWWCTIPKSQESAIARDTYELRISSNHVSFKNLTKNITWFDQNTTLGFNSGTFTFGHHSYTPDKDNSGIPGTWHWDNISISNSTSFTLLKASPRQITNNQQFTFPPAPVNSYLRFSAIGLVKINGVSVSPVNPINHRDHFSSYFIPIPQGSTSVTIQFSNDSWYTGPFAAKDAYIWSQSDSVVTTPTNTTVPTSTQTPTPTVIPTSIPTNTPTAITYRCQRRNPNRSWTTVWTGSGGTCP